MTALMKAASRGIADTVQLLLERGADASTRDAEGNTAASVAKSRDIGKMVQQQIAKGTSQFLYCCPHGLRLISSCLSY